MSERLLQRQIAKCRRADGTIDVEQLITLVGEYYDEVARERRLIERASRLMEEEMQAEIAQRRASEEALRHAQAQTEAASRAKSLFMANMSHELRTPLNAIIGFAEILREEVACSKAGLDCADMVNEISRNGQLLLTQINSILDMVRLEGGEINLAEAEIDAGRVLRRAIAEQREAADQQHLRIILDHGCDGLMLRIDPHEINKALENLLANAIRFSSRGGEVRVGCRSCKDGGVDLIVSDDGPGIGPEKLHDILQPFGQADELATKRHYGMGLGLPIARAIMHAHGGGLEIESRLGYGTRAILRLPPERVRAAVSALECCS